MPSIIKQRKHVSGRTIDIRFDRDWNEYTVEEYPDGERFRIGRADMGDWGRYFANDKADAYSHAAYLAEYRPAWR